MSWAHPRPWSRSNVNTRQTQTIMQQRHDPAIAFPNRSPDLRLAPVDLRGPIGTGKVVFHAPPGLGVRRFEPDGELIGEYEHLTDAFAERPDR